MRVARIACPRCWQELHDAGRNLRCDGCREVYPVARGIPSLLVGPPATWEELIRTLDWEMQRHPWVVLKMSVAACTWLPRARQRLLRSLPIAAGDLVLDHCTGRGGNLPGLRRAVGASGGIAAFDLSGYGLAHALRTVERAGWQNVRLQQADAHRLPYLSKTFDAVIHFGAWNQLASPDRALEEILRVTRPGGWVVLLDEGIEPKLRRTLWGSLLQWANPLFGCDPPIALLQAYGMRPEVRWVVRGMFYEVRFRTPV